MVKIFEEMPLLKLTAWLFWIVTLAIIINKPFGALLGFGIGFFYLMKWKKTGGN